MQFLHSGNEDSPDCARAAFAYVSPQETKQRYAFWKDTKMATFADTHAPAGFSIRFAEALRTLADRIVSNHQYRVTVRELSNLTSRELADLGINRANINQIALDCAFGRKA